jgi:GMP synthase-like glutamine amidotransferase
LASSATCENEIMMHQTKSMLGVQFHPEVSEENGKILFENFFNNFF